MSYIDPKRTALRVKDIGTWLAQRKVKEKALFCYRGKKSYYIVNGIRIDRDNFERSIPNIPPPMSRENYDRTKNFFHDKKSY